MPAKSPKHRRATRGRPSLRWTYRVVMVAAAAYWFWLGDAGAGMLSLLAVELYRSKRDDLPVKHRGEVFACALPKGWQASDVDTGGQWALAIHDAQESTEAAAYLVSGSDLEAQVAALLERVRIYAQPRSEKQGELLVGERVLPASRLKRRRVFGTRIVVAAGPHEESGYGLVFMAWDRLGMEGTAIEAIASSLEVTLPVGDHSDQRVPLVFPPQAPTDRTLEAHRLRAACPVGWEGNSVWKPPGWVLESCPPDTKRMVTISQRPHYPKSPQELVEELREHFYPGAKRQAAFERKLAGVTLSGTRVGSIGWNAWICAAPLGEAGAWAVRVHWSWSEPWAPLEQLLASLTLLEHAPEGSSASDPGRFELSLDRLFELSPGLSPDAPAGQRHVDDEEMRRFHVEQTREHLRRGDSRAALVVGQDPLVVAAYTDELDCVALLRFPDGAVEKPFATGEHLVTTNTYRRRSEGLASDLQPGRDDSEIFGQFFPYIADFLTDDYHALEERKAAISDREWARCTELAEAALERGQPPRDGCPP